MTASVTTEQAADLLKGLQDFAGTEDLGTKLSAATDQLKTLSDNLGENFDAKAVLEKLEEVAHMNEDLQKALKNAKTGGHFPGIEDEAKNLSMINIQKAMEKGDVQKYAPREYELCELARKEAIKKGHTMADVTSGRLFIPDQLIPDIIVPIYSRSAFIAMDGEGDTRVTVMDGLSAGKNTMVVSHGGMQAYWQGEESDAQTSQTEADTIDFDMKKLMTMTAVSEEMDQFAIPAFEKLLRKDMVKAHVNELDLAIAFGRGNKFQPRGIANWATGGHKEGAVGTNGEIYGEGIKIYHAGGAAGSKSLTYAEAMALSASTGFVGGELDFESFAEMQLVLEEDDIFSGDLSSVGCPRYFSRLKRAKIANFSGQTSAQPYLVGVPVLPDSRLSELIGPFGKMNRMRTKGLAGAGGAPYTIFQNAVASTDLKHSGLFHGDLSEVMVGRGPGLVVETDDGKGAGFRNDIRYIKTRQYVSVVVRQPRAIIYCPDVKVIA